MLYGASFLEICTLVKQSKKSSERSTRGAGALAMGKHRSRMGESGPSGWIDKQGKRQTSDGDLEKPIRAVCFAKSFFWAAIGVADLCPFMVNKRRL